METDPHICFELKRFPHIMGFFSFGKKKAVAEKETVELPIGYAAQWLEDSNKEKIGIVTVKFKGIWQELVSSIDEFSKGLKVLAAAKYDNTDRIYATVNSLKDGYIKKAQVSMQKVPRSFSTFSEARKAYTAATQCMVEIKNANVKEAYSMSTYFEKEMADVIKSLKKIDSLLAAFWKTLNNDASVIKLLDDINVAVEKCAEMENKISKNLEISGRLFSDLAKNRIVLEAVKQDLEKINLDGRWEKIDEIKADIGSKISEMEKISTELTGFVSPSKRPVKKILHDLNLDRESMNILEMFLEAPEKTTLENTEKIKSIFGSIFLLEKSNRINLDSKELDSIRSLLSKIKSGDVSAIKSGHEKITSEIRDLKSAFDSASQIEKIKKGVVEKKENLEMMVNKMQSEIESMERLNESLKKEIENKKSEVQIMLSEKLGKNFIIN